MNKRVSLLFAILLIVTTLFGISGCSNNQSALTEQDILNEQETNEQSSEEITETSLISVTESSTESTEETNPGVFSPENTNDLVNSESVGEGVSSAVYDGKIYIADESGIWTQNDDNSKKYICHNDAHNFAINRDLCIYVRTPDGIDIDSYPNASYVPKEMHIVDLDGNNDQVIPDLNNIPKPLVLSEDTLYYSDYAHTGDTYTKGIFELNISSGKTTLVVDGTGCPEAVGKTIFFIDDQRSDGTIERDGFTKGTLKSYHTETGKIESYGDTVFHTHLFNGNNQYIYVYTKPDQNFNTPEADLYRLDLQTNMLEKSIHLEAKNQVNPEFYNNGKIMFLEYINPGDVNKIHIVSASTGEELFVFQVDSYDFRVSGKGFLAINENKYCYYEKDYLTIEDINPKEQIIVYNDGNYLYYISKESNPIIEKLSIF